ncbi:MAG: bifunctional hydroxymethylpyrimidine kinase/phosphomethylpyrimidine kinase, partial [Clostridiales bacterium]|nr:bifunctional hydroxymethylpyrimidine kinase/phosphomethylpyrimidine kinase [Clostridiales bacterium]
MAGQKRVAAVHDLSGVGRCSLGVALPILSAAGMEVNALPTAVLSTQTDGFWDFTYRDLTEDLLPTARHWHTLGLAFDAVYTGFAASGEQLELLAEIVDLFRTKETLVVIDPVMADNGALYQTFDAAFPGEMRRFVQAADLILPNVTEACLLTGRDWVRGRSAQARPVRRQASGTLGKKRSAARTNRRRGPGKAAG